MLPAITVQIAIRLPEDHLQELDAAVARGAYPSRAAAMRAGLDRVLREERDRRIADEYRRAYGERPQDEWIGEAGAELAAEVITAREGPPER